MFEDALDVAADFAASGSCEAAWWDGYDIGWIDGYDVGYADGYDDGFADGSW